ncbi:unnamed protein product [Moneuplotes crassus]|uniref:Uncharacterized protein n=1 Tax=Euplotes crassus TaxID=5936 RepID=A0AAD1X288_EUPCR|nr:unnamed protein product [Moneuplotes crassus]
MSCVSCIRNPCRSGADDASALPNSRGPRGRKKAGMTETTKTSRMHGRNPRQYYRAMKTSIVDTEDLTFMDEETKDMNETGFDQNLSEVNGAEQSSPQFLEKYRDSVAFQSDSAQNLNKTLEVQMKQISMQMEQDQEDKRKLETQQNEIMASRIKEQEENQKRFELLETSLGAIAKYFKDRDEHEEKQRQEDGKRQDKMFEIFLKLDQRIQHSIERESERDEEFKKLLNKLEHKSEQRFEDIEAKIKELQGLGQGICSLNRGLNESSMISLNMSSSDLTIPRNTNQKSQSLQGNSEEFKEENQKLGCKQPLSERHQNAPIEESKCHDESESNQSVSEEPAADASEQADEPANNQESSVSMLTSVMSYFGYRN